MEIKPAGELTNDKLLDEFYAEVASADRWTSGDPPLRVDEFYAELKRRLQSYEQGAGR